MQHPPSALKPGARIGAYELTGPLGAGGMGEVWKARDTRLDRSVAIKFAHAAFSDRSQREAQAIAALNHPNIGTLYDVGPDYLVMEYVEGAPLRPTDDIRKLLDVAVQIADGLSAAHSAGIIHRDLKPDNILVSKSGRVKILDFGLAKQSPLESGATQAITMTQPGTVVGTVAYMSPEQARGQELDARSDQFSFGVILYQLATGKHPFPGQTAPEQMTAIIRESAPPLPGAVPPPLQWTIERCLEKDPADRYDSTRDLFHELRTLRTRLSGLAEPAAAAPARRSRALRKVVAPAAVAAIAIAAWWFFGRPKESPSLLTFTPVATSGCSERMPAWSPDGRSLAYICDVNEQGQVFARTVGSISAAQLTNVSGAISTPFWSADGSRVYFTLNGDLYFTGATGGPSRRLLRDAAEASLSPDGARLVFMRPSDLSIWLAKADGSEPVRFQPPGFATEIRTASARFSPDGTKLGVMIAAAKRGATTMDFWVAPLNGGAPKRIQLPSEISDRKSFSWLPDGRHLLVAMRRGDFESHIYQLDVSSGALRALTAGPRPEGSAEISPDGRRVATTIEDEVSDVMEFSLQTGKGRRMPSPSRGNAWPVWAHSGLEYAWVCTFGGQTRVLFQGETGAVRALEISLSDPIRRIDLAPDGQRLSLDGYGSKHRAMLVGINGGTPVEVDPPNSDTHGAVFSPDGEWIAYTRYADGGGQLAKVPASGGGTPVDLAKVGPSPGNALRWSPAGDWIAYMAPPGELRLASPDGKAQRTLVKTRYFGFAFNSKGDRIYGVRRDEKRQWAVWSVDVATGVERKETLLDVPPRSNVVSFDLHPDGKRFLTTVGASDSEIWIIDGLTGK